MTDLKSNKKIDRRFRRRIEIFIVQHQIAFKKLDLKITPQIEFRVNMKKKIIFLGF